MKQFYLIVMIIIALIYSCGERTLIRHYYILEIPRNNETPLKNETMVDGICEILRAKMPPAYDQKRIAVRLRSNEISYYQYHYWAMDPADNLTSLLEQQVQISQIFRSSSSGTLKGVPDYQIALDVYKFEVVDTEDSFYIQTEMQMDLIDYVSGKTILAHHFNKTKGLENRDLNLFAAELSTIFQEQTDIFISKIRSYFKKDNPRSPAENEVN